MKKVSNKFRDSLRGVRRLSAIVGYYTDDSYFILTTEDNKPLQTEDGNNLVTTETGIVEYDEGVINNVNVLFNTSLLKTTCKSVQIDCNNKIEVGTKINVRIGVYIPENDDFEYVNYGDYYIIDEPVYQADTKSYLITAYDKMVQSMVSYDSNPLNITYPITHKNLIKAICSKLGWEEELGSYDCETTEIKKDIYSGQGLTYRDILDDLNGAMGGSLMFAIDNQLICKQPTETNLVIEDDDLKDTNVDFGDKYGPVNALVISSNKEVVIDNRENGTSIQKNGKTEFKLNDNLLMIKQSDDFINDLFNKIDGLEYNIFDVSSTGILILEPLDIFTFRHDGVDYKTIMLNDDIQLSQGLEENLYVEKPEETESEYVAIDKNERKLNNAMISIDKANAEIVLKANSDGKVVQARLDADADEGSVFEVKADNIKLEGYTTINEGFSVDLKGNATMRGAKIIGGKIELDDEGQRSNPSVLIYDSSTAPSEERTLHVGDDLSGKTLKLSFPNNDFFTNEDSYNVIETDNFGKITLYSHWYSLSNHHELIIRVFIPDEQGGKNYEIFQAVDDEVLINLEKFDLPDNYGKITSISSGTAYNSIKADFKTINDYTKLSSYGVSIVDTTNDVNTSYGSNGFTVHDKYGDKSFDKFGIQWGTNFGSDYDFFGVNDDLMLYIKNTVHQLEVDENGCKSTAFNTTSLESQKKNFEKFKNALEIINNTDVYKYNLKHEDDKHKKHIGLVIPDKKGNYRTPDELINEQGNAIDIYSFVSVCCKAIQEQQEQIEKLQEEIESLKESDK